MSERWPHMMKRATAAAYCDLSIHSFDVEVAAGRLPQPVKLGGRDHWHRPAIDKALERLAGEPVDDFERDFWNRGKAA